MIYSIFYPVQFNDDETLDVQFSAEYVTEDNGLEDRRYTFMFGKIWWNEDLYPLEDNAVIREVANSKALKDAFDDHVENGTEYFEI